MRLRLEDLLPQTYGTDFLPSKPLTRKNIDVNAYHMCSLFS